MTVCVCHSRSWALYPLISSGSENEQSTTVVPGDSMENGHQSTCPADLLLPRPPVPSVPIPPAWACPHLPQEHPLHPPCPPRFPLPSLSPWRRLLLGSRLFPAGLAPRPKSSPSAPAAVLRKPRVSVAVLRGASFFRTSCKHV